MTDASPSAPPVSPTAPHPASEPPGLLALFTAFAKMSLLGFGGVLVWARRAIVDQHRWMTAEEFNETFALCHFLPGPNIVNLSVVFGARFRGIPEAIAAFAGCSGRRLSSLRCWRRSMRNMARSMRCVARWPACPARRSGCCSQSSLRMMMPLLIKRDCRGADRCWSRSFSPSDFCGCRCRRVLLVAIPLSLAATYARQAQDRDDDGRRMNPLWTLAWTFGLMSLFAVGGANSAIPEIHRIVVDVRHWMTDQQFSRRVCDLATVAGAERADRHADRLSGRRRLRVRVATSRCAVRAPSSRIRQQIVHAVTQRILAGAGAGRRWFPSRSASWRRAD